MAAACTVSLSDRRFDTGDTSSVNIAFGFEVQPGPKRSLGAVEAGTLLKDRLGESSGSVRAGSPIYQDRTFAVGRKPLDVQLL